MARRWQGLGWRKEWTTLIMRKLQEQRELKKQTRTRKLLGPANLKTPFFDAVREGEEGMKRKEERGGLNFI